MREFNCCFVVRKTISHDWIIIIDFVDCVRVFREWYLAICKLCALFAGKNSVSTEEFIQARIGLGHHYTPFQKARFIDRTFILVWDWVPTPIIELAVCPPQEFVPKQASRWSGTLLVNSSRPRYCISNVRFLDKLLDVAASLLIDFEPRFSEHIKPLFNCSLDRVT